VGCGLSTVETFLSGFSGGGGGGGQGGRGPGA